MRKADLESLLSTPVATPIARKKTVEEELMSILSRRRRQSKPIPDKFTLYESDSPFDGFLKTVRIDGKPGYTAEAFMGIVKSIVVGFLSKKDRPFQTKFVLSCEFVKEDKHMWRTFGSEVEKILASVSLDDIFEEVSKEFFERVSRYEGEGTGWVFEGVDSLSIHLDPFVPLRGSSYFPLPKALAAKQAVINVKNEDNECFKWAITSAVFPQKTHPERMNAELRANSETFDWTGIDFPTPLNQIDHFERSNGLSINVFGWDEGGVYPLRISKHEDERYVSLLLLESYGNQHYCWIKNESALVSKQVSRHNGRVFLCKYCCNVRPSLESLQKHQEYCSSHKEVKVVMPPMQKTKDGNVVRPSLSFKNYNRKMEVPFVVYADFEALTESVSTCSPDDSTSYTNQYQKHTPCSFSYLIKCYNNNLFPPLQRTYVSNDPSESVGRTFVEWVERDIVDLYDKFKFKKDMVMTSVEKLDFERATMCHICGGALDGDRVRDHCHLTGKYRGAAHEKCNLSYVVPKFYQVFFHNLSGYDAHMFVKDLAEMSGGISCIAKMEENYISFTKTIVIGTFVNKEGRTVEVKRDIHFLDSFKFMSSSLSELASNLTVHKNLETFFSGRKLELMKRKGVYPYDYTNTLERLDDTTLPPIKEFHSKLTDSDVSTGDYQHAQRVWSEFGMKSLREYHELYLKTDVLLLTDVFESFRKLCLNNYGLNPAWYFSSPGLAWDACLKATGVNLELLTDQDMLLMVEKGIRGGVLMISTRYGRANNKYIPEEYDPKLPSKYITYLDANNLYGWAMSRPLPTHDFKWMVPDELERWRDVPCILEVDLEYPHDLHNDYPLAPERVVIDGVEKLIPNLHNKVKYVVHHEALKTYVRLGLVVTKIHRGIIFVESDWLKPYITLNTRLHTSAKNTFESDFFKLMNNSVFGKTIENVRKRTNIKLTTTKEQYVSQTTLVAQRFQTAS